MEKSPRETYLPQCKAGELPEQLPKDLSKEKKEDTSSLRKDEKDTDMHSGKDGTGDEKGPLPSPVHVEGTTEDQKVPAVKLNEDREVGSGGTESDDSVQKELVKSMFEFMNTMGKRLDAIESKASSPVPSPVPVQPTASPVQEAPVPVQTKAAEVPATQPPPQQSPPQQAPPQQMSPQQVTYGPQGPMQMPPQGMPSPVQPQLDFFGFMRFIQSLPPEQKRLYFGEQAAEKPGDPMLQVFQQLDSDHAWVDIMEDLSRGQRALEE